MQLSQFGASIYVADLVGIGMVRDMGAMMTAIIMSGRTGAAFAAKLGTMKVTQEIDALTTMGISPLEFLVLPRVLALVLMMPLLCLFADLVGILGGLFVGVGMLDLSARQLHAGNDLDADPGQSVRRADQGDILRRADRDRRMPARLSMRQQLVGGRRRGDAGGGDVDRDGSGRLRPVRRGLQYPRYLKRHSRWHMHQPAASSQSANAKPHIIVRNLTMAYGSFVLMRDLNFIVRRGDIFIIMGGSGCGKSTLLRHLIGLKEPATGEIIYGDVNFTTRRPAKRERLLRRFGVLYQSGALWSSMTLAENVGLPLGEFTDLTPAQIREIAALKLALVGLKGFEDFYPSEISGGMQKRAGLARAMALDPEILFFDEPSAGLDPISSRLLDDLILELRDNLGATIVVVTHELASIFTIAQQLACFSTRNPAPRSRPAIRKDMLANSQDPRVRKFLTRGQGRRRLSRPSWLNE